jgi:pyrimidine operon attenuation protein/uracil phosphoribosyltransferase
LSALNRSFFPSLDLGKKERFKADNPFYLKENIDITNKNILLIDDIYTLNRSFFPSLDCLGRERVPNNSI